jgi:hypothetical protein
MPTDTAPTPALPDEPSTGALNWKTIQATIETTQNTTQAAETSKTFPNDQDRRAVM